MTILIWQYPEAGDTQISSQCWHWHPPNCCKSQKMEEVCFRPVQTLQMSTDHRPCSEYMQGCSRQWSLHLEAQLCDQLYCELYWWKVHSVQWLARVHGTRRWFYSSWDLCDYRKAGHCDHWQPQASNPPLWTHLPCWEEHRHTKHWEKQQICSLHHWYHSSQLQGELFWGVNKGIPQLQKPFHTEHTAQICQTQHHKVTVQVKHLRPQPDSLLSHLLVQGRAHLPRAPLPPPTLGEQEGCCLLLIDYNYGVFCVK